MKSALRIGTRGSALALWQARHVAALLAALPDPPATEIVEIRTEGDRVLDVPLSQVEGKAFFTKEIEEALADGRVDLAVHSLKDLPTELPEGLALGAVLAREDPRDVVLARDGRGFADLPAGARVGTSSLRRRALLARWRRDVELVELRGNVPTRVQRLDEGRFDAIVLAAAGIKRLGLAGRISEYLPLDRVLPAVSQGAVAVEVRTGDDAVLAHVRRLDDAATRAATAAERALLRRLEGGCQVPVGALATLAGETLTLRAVICALDGSQAVDGERSGPVAHAATIGRDLAGELFAFGGEAILRDIRRRGGAA
ncbi:MAG TPA: hydroxymethylbilane synthase [Thermoanaerobaculia bacterium]